MSMISPYLLNDIILTIDNSIKAYSTTYINETAFVDFSTSNFSELLYERTLSSFINFEIQKELSKSFTVRLFVNEYEIILKNGITGSIFNSLIHDVGGKVNSRRNKIGVWNDCAVDGFFMVKDLLYANTVTNVYIEYKLQNLFVLISLATDYLKYKTITFRNDSNTAFVYVVIDKNILYPTILSTEAPYYELINRDLSASPVSGTKRIYIYFPDNNSLKNNGNKKNLEDLNKSIELMALIKNYGDTILALADEKVQYLDDDKKIIASIKKFNGKVAKSQTLKDHSSYIHSLYKEFSVHPLIKKIINGFFPTDKTERNDFIIENACGYKNNLGNFLNGKKKKESIEKDGLNTNTNMSVLILSIMDLAKEELGIDIAEPSLHVLKIRGKNQEPAHWNEALHNNKDRLKKHYLENDTNRDGFNKLIILAYSINYYLENLFTIIYERDSNYNIIDEKKDYIYKEAIEDMQSTIQRLLKKLQYKDIHINIKNILENGNPCDSDLLKLLNKIISDFSVITE